MKFLLLFFLILFTHLGYAQKHLRYDTSAIQARSFNERSLQKLKQDKDFQYDRFVEPPESIWTRFWRLIWYKVDQLLQTTAGRITIYSLLILFAVGTVIFFVVKVTGMSGGGIFVRKSESSLPYSISNDDIHGISFEEAIEQAISAGNLRLAIRLLYLQSLKKLSDRGYIEWEINKTNSDYIREVMNRPWFSLFKSLTWKFEYTWYGEMNVNNDDFRNLHIQFQQFNNQL